MTRMEIGNWSPSTSLGFLRDGCREKKLPYDEDQVAKAVETLDGIPGWLTLYGYNYSLDPRDPNSALKKTLDEALKIVAEEMQSISRIATGWSRQMRVLKELSRAPKKFTELAEAASLSNQTLARHLDMLQRLHDVERDKEDRYSITDPILVEFVKGRGKH